MSTDSHPSSFVSAPTTYPAAEVQTLQVGDGDQQRSLHVETLHGMDPCLIWLGGFRSDISSSKARRLQQEAVQRGCGAVLFDYSGHGQSGGEFAAGTLSRWLDEALTVLRHHGGRSYILVGSSMGGWIATLLARQLHLDPSSHAKVAGLVLIAPALDMTTDLMWANMSEAQKTQLMEDGAVSVPSAYSPDPYLITRALIEDGHQHRLFGQPFEVACPVHVLQGQQDPDVPWEHALKLVEHLAFDDVRLSLIPDGDHRLSRPDDLDQLARAYHAMVSQAQSC
jgi:pimeloyl-ACP methyl ester carboxylesterase